MNNLQSKLALKTALKPKNGAVFASKSFPLMFSVVVLVFGEEGTTMRRGELLLQPSFIAAGCISGEVAHRLSHGSKLSWANVVISIVVGFLSWILFIACLTIWERRKQRDR